LTQDCRKKGIALRWKSWRYWRNLVVFGAGALFVALAVGALQFSNRVAMHYLYPQRTAPATDGQLVDAGIAYEPITLTTLDGLELAAWYTPTNNGALILLAHGYGGARSLEMHVLFARNDYGVLSWDFRAHGDSEGRLCTMGLLEARDVEAALDFALAQTDVERVGAYGGSMGAAALIEAAARRDEIYALVLEGAFPTLEEQFRRTVDLGILRPFVQLFAEREAGFAVDDLRPIDQIPKIQPRPVFILQGQEDRVIPPDSAQRLFGAAGDPRRLWLEPNVGHVGMFAADPEGFEGEVIGFFDEVLLQGMASPALAE
jgi:pimeloyl-ACP methyl ester carboxylesterase